MHDMYLGVLMDLQKVSAKVSLRGLAQADLDRNILLLMNFPAYQSLLIDCMVFNAVFQRYSS